MQKWHVGFVQFSGERGYIQIPISQRLFTVQRKYLHNWKIISRCVYTHNLNAETLTVSEKLRDTNR